MQGIITATGKAFDIEWCGPSTIDGALRFAVVESNMSSVLATFTDSAETRVLTHVFDDHRTTFRNYTTFKGVDLRPDNTIIVALMEAQT